MERLRRYFKKLSMKQSFILLIGIFLGLDIVLCLGTSKLLLIVSKENYNMIIPIMTIAYSVLCLLLASVLYYNIKLKKPINLIMKASEKIKAYDLDFIITYDGRDEMGALCNAFESMRECLMENNQQVWRQMEEKKQVNAAFAHDMRTPLTILKGYLEIFELQSETISPETISYNAHIMQKHVNRIENYVNAINTIQKLENLKLDQKKMEREMVIKELEQSGNLICEKVGKYFEMTASLAESMIWFDPNIVSQVFNNLLSNAARYAQTKVRLQITEDADHLILVICDDGVGFSENAQKKAFLPFYTESADSLNNGMGLYISSILCRIHKGDLTIKNTKTGGMVIARFLKKS